MMVSSHIKELEQKLLSEAHVPPQSREGNTTILNDHRFILGGGSATVDMMSSLDQPSCEGGGDYVRNETLNVEPDISESI
jgi:hypothetical protein